MRGKRFFRKNSYPALLLFLLALACLVGGCGQKIIQQDQELIDLQVYQPETVYLGVTLPADEDNELTRASFQVAANLINEAQKLDWPLAAAAGIPGYGQAKVELVWGESGTTPAAISAAADKLLDMGVVALVGGGEVAFSAAVAEQAAKYQLPLVSGAAQGDWLIDGVTYNFDGWFCRVAHSVDMESDALFAYLKKLNQTAAASIASVGIAYEDSSYGRSVLDSFNKYAETYDFQVVARIAYDREAASVAQEVQRMIANQPDVIVCAGDTDQTLLFLESYKASLYVPKLLFCYGDAFQDTRVARLTDELAMDYVCGIVSTPPLSQDLSAPLIETPSATAPPLTADSADTQAEEPATVVHLNDSFLAVNQMYRDLTGQDMDDAALMNFASVILLAQAIGSSGSSSPEVVSAALHSTTFEAPYLVSGSIAFDQFGQNSVMCGYMAILQEGRYLQAQ